MLSDADLDALDDLLLDAPDDEGMLLAEFDGFCAGLIVSPEMILPSEWLPLVWGPAGAERFETLEDVQRATDLIMRHYNAVARSLTPPNGVYGPLFDQDTRNGDILWELWVVGFERAMRLRLDTWERIALSGDEEAAACVNMMIALYDIAEGQSDLPKKSVRELTQTAPEMIPTLVVELNRWTKSATHPAPFVRPRPANSPLPPDLFSHPGQKTGQKTGRNDPCPCGSGKKYKKCCGGD